MGEKTQHRIYVAGAMTPTGPNNHAIEYLMNVRAGVRASTELLVDGFFVYCPMIDFQYFLGLRDGTEIGEDVIRGCSMSFLKHWAEAILVLPGWQKSKGTQDEIDTAVQNCIPVFYDQVDLFVHFDYVDRTKKLATRRGNDERGRVGRSCLGAIKEEG